MESFQMTKLNWMNVLLLGGGFFLLFTAFQTTAFVQVSISLSFSCQTQYLHLKRCRVEYVTLLFCQPHPLQQPACMIVWRASPYTNQESLVSSMYASCSFAARIATQSDHYTYDVIKRERVCCTCSASLQKVMNCEGTNSVVRTRCQPHADSVWIYKMCQFARNEYIARVAMVVSWFASKSELE